MIKNNSLSRRFFKLNFQTLKQFPPGPLLLFVKPLGGVLFRVPWLPQGLTEAKRKEILEVLATLCVHFRADVWYFKIRDNDEESEISDIFLHMDIQPVFVFLDADPETMN